MRRVHLIGVDHIIQHDGHMDDQKAAAIIEFQEYLRQQVGVICATVLAEEFSDDAIAKSRATISTAAQVAKELGIKHLFCDPGTAERTRLAIDSSSQRENYWASKLAQQDGEQVLFLCGDDHVASFSTVLRQQGMHACVLSKGWGKHLNPTRNAQD